MVCSRIGDQGSIVIIFSYSSNCFINNFSDSLSVKPNVTLLLVREERRGIVSRYDQGREEGALIDQWEDPKYEIYHMQDRLVTD